ncbi:MAG: damage-control phosphatase ARMT1 family protein [Thermoguttaceae bacterium]
MPASLDCIVCLTRQSLEAARFASSDEATHAAVLRRVLAVVQEKGFTTIPPLVAQEIQQIVREETESLDPYKDAKYRFNELMLSIRDSLRNRVRTSSAPLLTAVHVAIAGNTIDFAVRGDWTPPLVLEAVESALHQSINGDLSEFVKVAARSKNLLYLHDNCGEIVCDQILIEELQRTFPLLKIISVVRGFPVLNDVTREDAIQVGLDQTTTVIDNGNDVLGTALEQCSDEFMAYFHKSDLIVSKGLGNFETLSVYDSIQLPHPILYLFKAKCPFIAKYAGVPFGDLVIKWREQAAVNGTKLDV